MNRIDLCKPILFRHASLRFFEKGEYHITRRCVDDVLVLVYDGVLRFREDGIDRAIGPGEYYIQKANLLQEGVVPSDCPKYLYVHFRADWGAAAGLNFQGYFPYPNLKALMEELDRIAHSSAPYVAKAGLFYELLYALFKTQHTETTAGAIAQYIEENYRTISGLQDLCAAFHYSKNHIINQFRQIYHMTPIDYLNDIRLRRAMYLLEVTSDSAEQIAAQSGYDTYSHFYRMFRRKTGQAPSVWRKAILIQPVQK